MTLRKQVNVLPSRAKVLVVDSDTTQFNGTVDVLRKMTSSDDDLLLSSFVQSVVPLGFYSFKIVVKQRKVSNKEDNLNEKSTRSSK